MVSASFHTFVRSEITNILSHFILYTKYIDPGKHTNVFIL